MRLSIPATALVIAWLYAGQASGAPPVFSSGGGMGYYYSAYILSSEYTELGDNYLVSVRFIDNRGEVSDGEWLVNCSTGYPQVIRPDGENINIDLEAAPPSYMQTSHELWWAICRHQRQRYSESYEKPFLLHERENGQLLLRTGEHFSFDVLPMKGADFLDSLGTLRLKPGRSGKGSEDVVVYCSTSVPTVTWPDQVIELAFPDLSEKSNDITGPLSQEIYAVGCGQQ